MLKIPTFQSTSADFTETITLANQIVVLRIKYNTRAGYFFLDFTDSEGTTLYGIKIVPNWPLLRVHKALINFTGELMVVKTDLSQGDEITYDNFGNGWDLKYLTPDEILTWRSENGL